MNSKPFRLDPPLCRSIFPTIPIESCKTLLFPFTPGIS